MWTTKFVSILFPFILISLSWTINYINYGELDIFQGQYDNPQQWPVLYWKKKKSVYHPSQGGRAGNIFLLGGELLPDTELKTINTM
jgi:hypothetical protein